MYRRGNRKFNATKTKVDGILFDSKMEAAEYVRLKKLERAGAIQDLELQPRFVLLRSFNVLTNKTKNGKSKQGTMIYTPDFSYYQGMEFVVLETKGFADTAFKLHKKLLLSQMDKFEVDCFIESTANGIYEYRLDKRK